MTTEEFNSVAQETVTRLNIIQIALSDKITLDAMSVMAAIIFASNLYSDFRKLQPEAPSMFELIRLAREMQPGIGQVTVH